MYICTGSCTERVYVVVILGESEVQYIRFLSRMYGRKEGRKRMKKTLSSQHRNSMARVDANKTTTLIEAVDELDRNRWAR